MLQNLTEFHPKQLKYLIFGQNPLLVQDKLIPLHQPNTNNYGQTDWQRE